MQSQPQGEFAQLTAQFAEFRDTYAQMAAEHGESALHMLNRLAHWAGHMTAAPEAASRAPETDRLLARAWSARLMEIVEDARQLLLESAVSIEHHETGIPLPRISKPAPQPVARPTGRRAPHPRRRRR